MLVKVIDIDNSFEVNINKKCGSTKKRKRKTRANHQTINSNEEEERMSVNN